MAESRFDILFDGTLLPGADPIKARARLGAAFKLDAAGVERLFCGKTMVIKRDADAATVERYQRVFAEAGAVVRLKAVSGETPEQPLGSSAAAEVPEVGPGQPPANGPRPPGPVSPDSGPGPKAPAFSVSAEFEQLEEPPSAKAPALDLSHLSLVAGSDWDLSDCAPPAPSTPVPDISHLSLVETEPTGLGGT